MVNKSRKKLLIFGSSGMLGFTLYKYFSLSKEYKVFGTIRNRSNLRFFSENITKNLRYLKNVFSEVDLDNLFKEINPDYVINCIGIVKQGKDSNDHIKVVSINSLLPHIISKKCFMYGARFIQISTDCVFSGKKGMYNEIDMPDAYDLYGRSKLLGEVLSDHSLTLRTSIIGHELFTSHSLLEWFLKQTKTVKGYKKAIFSGFPTIEIARILDSYVLSDSSLSGLYHLSSNPINKYDLLSLIAEAYNKIIELIPDEKVVIDRSLNSSNFRNATGFHPKTWKQLIYEMYDYSQI